MLLFIIYVLVFFRSGLNTLRVNPDHESIEYKLITEDLEQRTNYFTWIGQATILLDIDGTTFLFDPIFSERASPFTFIGPKRNIPPVIDIDNLPNIDYVFILREPYITNRKRIYENYAGMFPTFESFCQVMDQCTENYECLVINNNAKSNKLTDQVFWYKAEPHDDFKIGAPSFWEYSEKNILKEGENEQLNSGYKNKVLVKKNELY